jgi:hypothetical protein
MKAMHGGGGPTSLSPSGRRRFPWSNADTELLADMVRDGYTRKAIASALGRSVDAITPMAKKLGLTMRRGQTRELVVALKPEAIAQLQERARPRRLTVNSFCRVLLEVAARSPDWLDRLLDDDMGERNDALPLQPDPRPSAPPPSACPLPVAEKPATADTVPTFVVALSAVQPQLTGRM